MRSSTRLELSVVGLRVRHPDGVVETHAWSGAAGVEVEVDEETAGLLRDVLLAGRAGAHIVLNGDAIHRGRGVA